MALPGYMKITAENQGQIEGECDLDSREIRGQRPVIQMLDSVPLQLPEVAAHCW